MDGLPGMQRGLEAGKREKIEPITKMVGPYAPKKYQSTSPRFALEHGIITILFVFLLLIVLTHPSLDWNELPSNTRISIPQPKGIIGTAISGIGRRLR
jgi:hypothetical protein